MRLTQDLSPVISSDNDSRSTSLKNKSNKDEEGDHRIEIGELIN